MDELSDIPQLNKQEFDVFLLIYAAHVDYEFTEDEKSFIKKRTDETTYKKVWKIFQERGDFQNFQILMKYSKIYYDTAQLQAELIEMLKETFKSDGDFSRVERVFVTFFKKMSKL